MTSDEQDAAITDAVMKMAADIPLDASLVECSVALIESMGDRTDEKKLTMMAPTFVAALRIIRRGQEGR